MSDLDPVSVAVQQIRQVAPGATMDDLKAELSVGQLAVLEALMTCKTLTDAAEVTAISRSVIYRWLGKDPYFKAAVNAWKQEIREAAEERIAALLDKAAANVQKAVEEGDTKLSYRLLKDVGTLRRRKDAPTDPALVRQQLALDIHQQSPIASPQQLTALLSDSGLSRDQQRRLLIDALRPLRRGIAQ